MNPPVAVRRYFKGSPLMMSWGSFSKKAGVSASRVSGKWPFANRKRSKPHATWARLMSVWARTNSWGETTLSTYGRNSDAALVRRAQLGFSLKMSLASGMEDLSGFPANWSSRVIGSGRSVSILRLSSDPGADIASSGWPTPTAKAKNVILFIGDGMTIAHRTAARILSKGLVEGRYGGELEK